MDDNTKLEIAIEIMSAKIAKVSKEVCIDKDDKLKELMEERNRMYKFDRNVVNKIITVYGKELH